MSETGIVTNEYVNKKITVKDMAYIGLFSVVISVCSWISIPTAIPFTLQTFAIFCAMGILGGKRAFFSVLVYVVLGMIGLPVWQGFTGGLGIILGSTGGYIIGFLLSAILYWIITKFFGDGIVVMIAAMLMGLVVCYAFGTAWFMVVYARDTGEIGVVTALLWCVAPFVIPDIIKMIFAVFITKRVSKYVGI